MKTQWHIENVFQSGKKTKLICKIFCFFLSLLYDFCRSINYKNSMNNLIKFTCAIYE